LTPCTAPLLCRCGDLAAAGTCCVAQRLRVPLYLPLEKACLLSCQISGGQSMADLALEAPFWGFMGAAFALVFSNLGAAYGTGKSGIGISTLGVSEPDKIMKNIVPVVMAGVLGIYGLIIAVIIANGIEATDAGKPAYSNFAAFAHFGGGMSCGLSGLAAGMAIGIVGDTLTRASAREPKLFVGMVLILIFAEALGLYGLIVGLILSSKV